MFIQPERLLTIVNKRHLSYAKNQLDDRPSGTVIVQPHERQTGPGILYPLLHVYQRDPEAIACLFPSDHFILNEQNFMKHIEFSSRFVAENPQSFLLLGVNPKQPDAVTATQLYNKGSLWNTMVVVGKVRKLLTLFKTYTPIVYQAFWEIRDVLGSSLEAQVVEDMYTRLAPMNFSYSILEKNPAGLRAVKVQGAYWNDWGNAARIQSDIQCFCTAKGTSAVLLPFEKMFDSTDSVQKSQGGA
jgi:mannose-1-phosphate guanylyltransferase